MYIYFSFLFISKVMFIQKSPLFKSRDEPEPCASPSLLNHNFFYDFFRFSTWTPSRYIHVHTHTCIHSHLHAHTKEIPNTKLYFVHCRKTHQPSTRAIHQTPSIYRHAFAMHIAVRSLLAAYINRCLHVLLTVGSNGLCSVRLILLNIS